MKNNELAIEAEKCIAGIVKRFYFDQPKDIKQDMIQEALTNFLAGNKKGYVYYRYCIKNVITGARTLGVITDKRTQKGRAKGAAQFIGLEILDSTSGEEYENIFLQYEWELKEYLGSRWNSMRPDTIIKKLVSYLY